jgi:low temperature requirement protein LtrA
LNPLDSISGRLRRTPGESQGASSLELFYDLVFVFAVTQVSHILLDDVSWTGAGQALLALLAVWSAWNYTTWVTNELDPESAVVRLVLLLLMLASLLLAISIPEAFGERALLFAGSYVAIQVGRHLFLTFVAASSGTPERDRAERILTWFVFSGIFWIAGALVDGTTRTELWLIALLIDWTAPLHYYWVPWLGRTEESAWEVEPGHFNDRFSTFVIIALGESIVLIGAPAASHHLVGATLIAVIGAFVGTAAIWWLYFSSFDPLAEKSLIESPKRTELARDVFTYGHAPIVAAIILTAVADELVIAHPSETLPTNELIAVVGGTLLYLVSEVVLRFRMTRKISTSRVVGAGACLIAGAIGTASSAMVTGLLLLCALVGVALWDQFEARGPSIAR